MLKVLSFIVFVVRSKRELENYLGRRQSKVQTLWEETQDLHLVTVMMYSPPVALMADGAIKGRECNVNCRANFSGYLDALDALSSLFCITYCQTIFSR